MVLVRDGMGWGMRGGVVEGMRRVGCGSLDVARWMFVCGMGESGCVGSWCGCGMGWGGWWGE